MKRLILIRGDQGSGKSTLARVIQRGISAGGYRTIIVEADGWFIRDGKYEFILDELPEAHQSCRDQVEAGMADDLIVIVANTFSRNWEMEPYKLMADKHGYDVNVIECQNNFGSIHDVPEGVIERTRAGREPNAL